MLEEACNFLSALDSSESKSVGDAAHELVHFITDADLRSKDQEYDFLMRRSLEKMMKDLESLRIS